MMRESSAEQSETTSCSDSRRLRRAPSLLNRQTSRTTTTTTPSTTDVSSSSSSDDDDNGDKKKMSHTTTKPTTSTSTTKKKKSRRRVVSTERKQRQRPTLIRFITLLMIAGSALQVVLYHPVVLEHQQEHDSEHWFDHDSWKVSKLKKTTRKDSRVMMLSSSASSPTRTTLMTVNKTVATTTLAAAAAGAATTTNDGARTSFNNYSTTTSVNLTTTDDNPILSLLRIAGVPELTVNETKTLPSWQKLTSVYGPLQEPIIIGMETCERYREQVPLLSERYTGVAGLFNTGTNAMQHHLHVNLNLASAWQIPWGKHRMEFVRLNHTAYGMEGRNKLNALPIVLIRDPYHWMHSMCKTAYATKWNRWRKHCPNLVPTEADRKRFHNIAGVLLNDTFPVKVVFDKNEVFYWDSLAHLWNDWYQRYLQADYPRLMVRFEDMLLFGPAIMKKIAECTGSTVPDEFEYQQESAKRHGSGTTFLKAIEKTGNVENRVLGMTREDLGYARTHLDGNLMRLFQYSHPKINDDVSAGRTS